MLHRIYIISDGTGRTAQNALKAALVQFQDTEVQIHIRPNIRSESEINRIISEAQESRGLVIHTVVAQKMRDKILDAGRLNDVDTIDLMGPLLAQLSRHFSDVPSEQPGVYHDLNKSYFQRIEAVEFTFRHDDGQKISELDKAEIVLLGVSRTFKTPVSIYLAYRGWQVANVPIILNMQVPDQLFNLEPARVFCLTTSPIHLAELRKIRARHLGGATGKYSEVAFIRKEINFARQLYNQNPNWTRVDVTNKPVEEIASEIRHNLKSKNVHSRFH